MRRAPHRTMHVTPWLVWALGTAALLALAGIALAQSGGPYGLTWHSVDGGGHTFSTGGDYSLGGAVGQADAQPTPAAGGSYALQGGFWRPACSPQEVAVGARCVGTTLVLGWAANDANMAYDIHRSTAPYFTPDLTTKAGVTTGQLWPDSEHCGSPAVNYFYQVRATCIGAHVDSDRQGEFDFALTPGQ